MPDTPEKNQPEDTPQYAGKYKSIEEFEKGHWNLHQEGMVQRDGRIRAEAERDALQRQLNAQPVGPDPNEVTLREADLPVDELKQMIGREAQAQAMQVIQETLGPLTAAAGAQQEVAQAYEDFDLNKVQKAVASDAMISEQYQHLLATDPKAAYTLGYQAMKAQEQGAAVEAPLPTKGKEKMEPTRRQRDAAPPSGARSGVSNPVAEDSQIPNDEQYNELLEMGYQGNWTPFLRARFGAIMDEHPDPTLHLDDPASYR